MLFAPCPLPHALCPLLHALCALRYAPCVRLRVPARHSFSEGGSFQRRWGSRAEALAKAGLRLTVLFFRASDGIVLFGRACPVKCEAYFTGVGRTKYSLSALVCVCLWLK